MHRILRLLLVTALAIGLFMVALSVLGAKQKTSISGTVVDAAGLPIADVTVVASRNGAAVGRTTTNGSGSIGFFVMNSLPTPGTYTIEFSKPGYMSETRTVVLGQTGAVNDVSPKLNPSTSAISGLVTEDVRKSSGCGDRGCPLETVQVTVTDSKGSKVRSTRSATSPPDQKGRYSIAGIPSGDYILSFTRSGYVAQTVRLTLTDNKEQVLDLRLKGVVGSISGNAEGCAQVEIALRDGTTQVPPVITRVRSSGDYEFVRVQTRGEYLILFEGPGGSVDNTFGINIDGGEKLTGVDGKCNSPDPVLSSPPGR